MKIFVFINDNYTLYSTGSLEADRLIKPAQL